MSYLIVNTDHLAKRARERGFTTAQAKGAIRTPNRISKVPPRKGNHGGFIWLFFKEYADRVLVVVAEVKRNECWIITGYWA